MQIAATTVVTWQRQKLSRGEIAAASNGEPFRGLSSNLPGCCPPLRMTF